jgi:hypothetical protein
MFIGNQEEKVELLKKALSHLLYSEHKVDFLAEILWLTGLFISYAFGALEIIVDESQPLAA